MGFKFKQFPIGNKCTATKNILKIINLILLYIVIFTNMIKENHPGEEDNVGNTPHFFSMLKNSVRSLTLRTILMFHQSVLLYLCQSLS